MSAGNDSVPEQRTEIALDELMLTRNAPQSFYEIMDRVLRNQPEHQRNAIVDALADLVSVWGTPEVWATFQWDRGKRVNDHEMCSHAHGESPL